MAEEAKKISTLSCVEFVAELASKAPAPGGGGAAALCGALGAALGNMVIQLTLGKKRYAEHEEAHLALQDRLTELQNDLLEMIDRDAADFLPLAAAYGIKATTDEEKAAKQEVLQKALKNASVVPMEIVRAAHKALHLQEQLAETGSRLAISDVACGVQALRTALLAGRVNVLINLGMITDEAFVRENKAELDTLCQDGVALADRIYATVERAIWKD